MNRLKKTVVVSKRYSNRIDESVARKAVLRAAVSGIGNTLAKVGWKHRPIALEISSSGSEHVYQASVTFMRDSQRQYTEENFEKQWAMISPRFTQRCRSAGWYAAGENVKERYVNTDDGLPAPSVNGKHGVHGERSSIPDETPNDGSIVIPANWSDHFSHIYDREDQIREVIESVQTAKETGMQVRNHCLLFGPSGCGKTEVGLALAAMLGNDAVFRLDATSTTKAGAENLLLMMEPIPPIIIIEELEKVNEANLPWLLGILDDRGEIIKTNARIGTVSRKAKCLVIATVNNLTKFEQFQEGALCNRFGIPLYFPMPDRELLRKILLREVKRIPGGKEEWIEPALDYALGIEKTFQARRIKAIMTNARDRLLDGSYQESRSKMLASRENDGKAIGQYRTGV